MNLDKGTFGKSRACVALARILSEKNDLRSTRKIGTMLGELNTYCSSLYPIPDGTFKAHLIDILVRDKLFHLEESTIPADLKSYVRNAIIYFRREAMRKMKERQQKAADESPLS